ncbi:MAG: 30S ribosomal protein S12 methylthiotransferase RimO [Coriobacteriia bacterium]|nr:30S ribosomal protein S12 methylthiotransferase RimO [Coriobacteriia bacterium]
MSARRVVHILTLGCPKNEVDSDRMAASLAPSFDLVDDLDAADVAIVNTCSFIREATEESIGTVLGLTGEWKAARPGRFVIVAGCMPARYGDELAASMPEVDAFVPVASEAGLARVVAGLTGSALVSEPAAPTRTAPGPSAYIQVADGCHRRCTFCTIPDIRGDYVSRSLPDVLAEARLLVDGGARELILVGQDVSSWGRDLPGAPVLADLVREVARVEGLSWLRLMYVQPDGITPELLDVMATEPTVCRYLDMPLQHASRPVLRRMARSGDAAEFLRLIGVIRDLVPGVFLRTTLISGFPGETRDDAARLVDFVRDAGIDYVGVFEYSAEEGTPAATMDAQVSARTRRARTQRLRDAAFEVGTERAALLVGRTLAVLVEGVDEDGVTIGRHRGQAPEIDGLVLLDRDLEPGTLVEVEIVDALGYDLVGEVRS